MMTLRDYQQEMTARLYRVWEGHRAVMVQMPTGTGKTVVLAEVTRRETGAVLVVTHRRELVEQIENTLLSYRREHDFAAAVTVMSIQKLTRLLEDEPEQQTAATCQDYSLIVIDEAHHAVAKTYRRLWERWPEARFLGLTATPCRLNGTPFTDLFDVLLESWSIQEFIAKGWLSDFDYVSAAPDSEMLRQVSSLSKRGIDGDYQTKEMATVMDVPASIAHLYDTYRAFAEGKRGIVYAIDRQHAQHIAEHYRRMGESCEVINSKTPAQQRKELVAAYREGRLQVLVNVDIFGEGFDVPEVEFIQLARPTLSLSKFLQQVGRGMRISPGKEAVVILDNVGLYQLFGLPTEERDWQQAFLGRLSGKGQAGMARPVVIKEDRLAERMLVNLEMVRIRQRSESLEGLNIYVQNGKYGIMRNGRPTTRPLFERVTRCNSKRFFALATYPYAYYRSRTTVIDQQGADLMVQLYGQIQLKGDFVYGSDSRGRHVVWDAIGRSYYDELPRFDSFGGIDMLPIGKSRTGEPLYELRARQAGQRVHFTKGEMLYNQHFVIIRNLLIQKTDYRCYTILGYSADSVLVYGRDRTEFFPIYWDGHRGDLQTRIPDIFSRTPDCPRLKLEGGWARHY